MKELNKENSVISDYDDYSVSANACVQTVTTSSNFSTLVNEAYIIGTPSLPGITFSNNGELFNNIGKTARITITNGAQLNTLINTGQILNMWGSDFGAINCDTGSLINNFINAQIGSHCDPSKVTLTYNKVLPANYGLAIRGQIFSQIHFMNSVGKMTVYIYENKKEFTANSGVYYKVIQGVLRENLSVTCGTTVNGNTWELVQHKCTCPGSYAICPKGIWDLHIRSLPFKIEKTCEPTKNLTVGMSEVTFVPLTCTGGMQPYTYSVSPELPVNVTYSFGVVTVNGKGLMEQNKTKYTFTITDAEGASIAFDVNMGIYGTPVAVADLNDQQYLTVGMTPGYSFTPLKITSGGARPFKFTSNPSLPEGLSFDQKTGAITVGSQLPVKGSGRTKYEITMRDANNISPTKCHQGIVYITIYPAPVITKFSQADQCLTVSQADYDFQPVSAATGGRAPLTYTVTPDFPLYNGETAGLVLDSTTGIVHVSGKNLKFHDMTTYNFSVRDANMVTATSAIPIEITIRDIPVVTCMTIIDNNVLTPLVSASSTTNSLTLTCGRSICFTPLTSLGGTPPLKYFAFSGQLPAGLTLNPDIGLVSGVPIPPKSPLVMPYNSTVVFKVKDANNVEGVNISTVTFKVNATPVATANTTAQVITKNDAGPLYFTPLTCIGGTMPYTFTVVPDLPVGFLLDATSGIVTVNPDFVAVQNKTEYIFSVMEANGFVASKTSTVSVTVNDVPLGIVTSMDSYATTVGQKNFSFTPLCGCNGMLPLKYTVSPVFPVNCGFALDANTGVVNVNGQQLGAFLSLQGLYKFSLNDANGVVAKVTQTIKLTANPAPVVVPSATTTYLLTTDMTNFNITPLTCTVGTNPLVYSVSPNLPSGLSMDPTTGLISVKGSLLVSQTAQAYRFSVTDANNVAGSTIQTLTFTIFDRPTAQIKDGAQILTVGQVAQTSFTPLVGGEGSIPLFYEITADSPPLPSGLSLNKLTGVVTIVGSALLQQNAMDYIFTVRDQNNVRALTTNKVSITICNAPIATCSGLTSQVFTVNQSNASFTPINAFGGVGPLYYDTKPALPQGLNLDHSTGVVNYVGCAFRAQPISSYTFMVQDANGVLAVKTCNVMITINNPPTATSVPNLLKQQLTSNQKNFSFTPLLGTSGTSPLVYSVTPDLPAPNITINPATGLITVIGENLPPQVTTYYTVSVTDANKVTALVKSTVSIVVVPGPMVTKVNAVSHVFTMTQANENFQPLIATGGVGPLTYTSIPALPQSGLGGIYLDAFTGVVHVDGSKLLKTNMTSYVFSVQDVNGVTGNTVCAVNLTVNEAPTVKQTADTEQILTVNQILSSFKPITILCDGTSPLTYSVSPLLPSGILLNPTDGTVTISGTYLIPQSKVCYKFSVKDDNNVMAKNTVNIWFTVLSNPESEASPLTSQVFTVSQDNDTFVPLTVCGGLSSPTLSYVFSVKPDLPTGMKLNTSTGVVSITGSAIKPCINPVGGYLFSVKDANGVAGTETNTVSIIVNDRPQVKSTNIKPVVLTVNEANYTFIPLSASNGTYPLRYSVTPALPAGIELITSTGAVNVSGKALCTQATENYAFRVTDANNVQAETFVTVSITINPGMVIVPQPVNTQRITIGQIPYTFEPLVESGGSLPLVYTSTDLPAGLKLLPNGNVSVNPLDATMVAQALKVYTFTVTDINNMSLSVNCSIEIYPKPTASASTVTNYNLTVGCAPLSFTPLVGGGGRGPLTYSYAPALPSGFSFDDKTCLVSVDGSCLKTGQSSLTFTLTDYNKVKADVTSTINIKVVDRPVATQLYNNSDLNLTVNGDISPIPILTATGGTGKIMYYSDPALPSSSDFPVPGIGLDHSTGVLIISGKNLTPQPATKYTFYARDSNGVNALNSSILKITVNIAPLSTSPPLMAAAAAATTKKSAGKNGAAGIQAKGVLKVKTVKVTLNKRLNPPIITLSSVTGGFEPYTFVLSAGVLPEGLTLEANSGLIIGTPTMIETQEVEISVRDVNNVYAENTCIVKICVNNNGGFCFPGSAVLTLADKSTVRMSELTLGHKVQSGPSAVSEVYLFTHALVDPEVSFLELKTLSGHVLRLTGGHYLYVNGVLATAESVKLGDNLTTDEGPSAVSEITAVRDTGLYNPHTLSGDIMVNGIWTSTYTNSMNADLAHAILAPVRYLYNLRK